jgi:hypothetical protein
MKVCQKLAVKIAAFEFQLKPTEPGRPREAVEFLAALLELGIDVTKVKARDSSIM